MKIRKHPQKALYLWGLLLLGSTCFNSDIATAAAGAGNPDANAERMALLEQITGPAVDITILTDGIEVGHLSYVFIIHADSFYEYKSGPGEYKFSDIEELKKARMFAESCFNCEVFIFYQGREPGLFVENPLASFLSGESIFNEGAFVEQFLNRTSIRSEKFSRLYHGVDLTFESRYYRDNSITMASSGPLSVPSRRILFYHGYNLPEFESVGYSRTNMTKSFSVDIFVDGLKKFVGEESTQDNRKFFDLVILASCNGGTPYTLETLAPIARKVIASPELVPQLPWNFDPFLALGKQPVEQLDEFYEEIAGKIYNSQLAHSKTLTLTIALYDLEEAAPYFERIMGTYRTRIAEIIDADRLAALRYRDCYLSREFKGAGRPIGVDVLYYRQNQNEKLLEIVNTHSGWGCPYIKERRKQS